MNPEDPDKHDEPTGAPRDEDARPEGEETPPTDPAIEADQPVEPDLPASDPEPAPEHAIETEPEPPLTLREPQPESAPPPPREPARRRGGFGGYMRRVMLWAFLLVVVAPLALTLIYKVVPPPFTLLMVQRVFEGKGWDYRWRSIDRMSPALVQAAIAAEDARFCEHHGFDFEAMEKAWKNNKRGGRVKGGSTISQQTAKNVFLWPARSYVRKGLEAYFTVLIETVWGKRRIMEVYLNVAEMGSGTYGVEAASRRYFGVGADKVTRAQAARLVAILPNPLKYRAVKPGRYVAGRSRRIGAAAGTVRNEGLAACVGKLRRPAEKDASEPVIPARPTVRKPAPATKTDPLPLAAPTPPATAEEPAPAPAPAESPVFETPPNSD